MNNEGMLLQTNECARAVRVHWHKVSSHAGTGTKLPFPVTVCRSGDHVHSSSPTVVQLGHRLWSTEFPSF
ncbi:hypothetical protein BaRGS_00032379, partial [Batillaria attramentaria]